MCGAGIGCYRDVRGEARGGWCVVAGCGRCSLPPSSVWAVTASTSLNNTRSRRLALIKPARPRPPPARWLRCAALLCSTTLAFAPPASRFRPRLSAARPPLVDSAARAAVGLRPAQGPPQRPPQRPPQAHAAQGRGHHSASAASRTPAARACSLALLLLPAGGSPLCVARDAPGDAKTRRRT